MIFHHFNNNDNVQNQSNVFFDLFFFWSKHKFSRRKEWGGWLYVNSQGCLSIRHCQVLWMLGKSCLSGPAVTFSIRVGTMLIYSKSDGFAVHSTYNESMILSLFLTSTLCIRNFQQMIFALFDLKSIRVFLPTRIERLSDGPASCTSTLCTNRCVQMTSYNQKVDMWD